MYISIQPADQGGFIIQYEHTKSAIATNVPEALKILERLLMRCSAPLLINEGGDAMEE